MAGVDSGIKVDTECARIIGLLEKREFAFMIMRIQKPEGSSTDKVMCVENLTVDECKEEVEKDSVQLKGDETAGWYCFRTHLAKYDIAYGAAFVEYKSADGRATDKLVYVMWNTDDAKMKQKMVYSSTKVLNKFKTGVVKHQASDSSDTTYNEILARVK